MRIATWNVNSLGVRMPRVEAWLADFAPDVLCMQETKLADDAFPSLAFSALGYESYYVGEGRWNGVAILSKVGLEDPAAGFDDGDEPDAEARLCWATCGGMRIASCYIPNGRSLEHEHYQYKLRWLSRLHSMLINHNQPTDNVALLGDFNVAPEDRDIWDPKKFIGETHASEPERTALAKLCGWGLEDVFRRFYDDEGLYSWWDYRGGNFHKRMGLRIDLALLSKPLADRSTRVLIDRNARKGEQPSDHAPVVVDIA